MTKTRIKVIYYFLFKNTNGISLKEIIKYFFAKSYKAKAGEKISVIENDPNWYIVYFKGMENKPLFYPRKFDIKALEQVAVESFYEDNWHYYEIEQTKVTENDIVIDCGAAEGLFSLVISHRCKTIYAIEPLKEFINSLSLTFSKSKNVNIIGKALSNKNGLLFIRNQGISSKISNEKNGDAIEVTTLDKLFFDNNIPVSYIKIDLEGYDFLALQGGVNLIKKNLPKIAVTTYHNSEHSKQITEFLLDIYPGYKIITKGIYQETGSPIMLHAWI